MSDGANHFDQTTQGGLIAAAWWDRMSEAERETVLAAAHTKVPAIAYLAWQRWQELAENARANSGSESPANVTKERDALRAVLREIVNCRNNDMIGQIGNELIERAEKLLNRNATATEGEPFPVSPPVSHSVAAALLDSTQDVTP